MGSTTFSGPVTSTNGFVGAVTGAVTSTTFSASTSLAVGGGTVVTKIIKGTVSLNPSSLTTGTGELLVTALTGAIVGDCIKLHPPAAGITTGLAFYQTYVSDADQITTQVWNHSGGTINEGATVCPYTIFRS